MFEISVTHSIDAGHRVVGHEDGKGKCARLHGHTYVFEVHVLGPELDAIGFVCDFGVIKAALDEWDHRMILWDSDPLWEETGMRQDEFGERTTAGMYGIVNVPFNPTAENMARHFAERFIDLEGIEKATVEVRETPKTVARFTATDVAAFTERVGGLLVASSDPDFGEGDTRTEEDEAFRLKVEDENPNYGPGNPDWERDFEKDST